MVAQVQAIWSSNGCCCCRLVSCGVFLAARVESFFFFLIASCHLCLHFYINTRGREKEKYRGWWGELTVRYKQCGIISPCYLHVEQLPGFKWGVKRQHRLIKWCEAVQQAPSALLCRCRKFVWKLPLQASRADTRCHHSSYFTQPAVIYQLMNAIWHINLPMGLWIWVVLNVLFGNPAHD